jgi:hypothetical protein
MAAILISQEKLKFFISDRLLAHEIGHFFDIIDDKKL